jgi:hypothetical protein
MKRLEQWPMMLYLATVAVVGLLVLLGAPGMSANPSWFGAVLWLLLFIELLRGVSVARIFLITWNLLLLAVLLIWEPFDDWGIAAFAVLIAIQVLALLLVNDGSDRRGLTWGTIK